jgi:hypothetical protein
VKKQPKLVLAVIGFVILIIIGVSNCGNAAPNVSTSPVASGSAFGLASGSPAGSPSGSPVGSPTATVSSAPATTAPPRHTATPHPQTTAPAAAPPQTTAPPAVASTSSSCYPLSNEGTCYEPGEYCRKSDHGASGVAGDGKRITCEDNDGWRWEPA